MNGAEAADSSAEASAFDPNGEDGRLRLVFGLALVALLWGGTTPFIRIAAQDVGSPVMAERGAALEDPVSEEEEGQKRDALGRDGVAGSAAKMNASRKKSARSSGSRARATATRTTSARDRMTTASAPTRTRMKHRTRRGASSGSSARSSPPRAASSTSNFFSTLLSLRHIVRILVSVRFYLPYGLNQLGSLVYYLLLGEFDVALMVPAANGLALAVTGVTELLVCHKRLPNSFELLGIACILLGVGLCVEATRARDREG